MTPVESAFKQFKSSMPWLESRTIFLTRHGSHAYGLNTPTSDEDFKGFAVAPSDYYLGFVKRFEQAECKNPDMVIYDIQKFCNLAADCNPSIIEVLFTDRSDWIKVHPLFDLYILPWRDLFLSQKAKHTFSGYAMSQLKRIQRHYAWLTNPPKREPTREDFDLPERTTIPGDQRAHISALVTKEVNDLMGMLDLDELDPATALGVRQRLDSFLDAAHIGQDEIWKSAAYRVGVPFNVLEVLLAERAYNAARETWRQYQNWKAKRNPARAELEARFGYDTKHAMHLVRLMRMGKEILETGKVIVKRPDREELLAIRQGCMRYEELIEYAKKMDDELTQAQKTSPLPHKPDRQALDDICIRVVDSL